PARRKTSVRVRTAVVFPVPPFCERTAILRATPGQSRPLPGGVRTCLKRGGVLRPVLKGEGPASAGPIPPLLLKRSRCSARRLLLPCRLQRRPVRLHRRRVAIEENEPVAPDDDLVAVVERPPLDAVAVDEHAVEAAVVEHP